MKFQSRPKHVIDLIFPIALFFVFAVSAFAVLLLASNLYGSTTEQISANDESRTCLSYIAQKIRQNDIEGGISITQVEGRDCLTLSADYNGTPCTTYIYEYDGSLKELFTIDGVAVSLKSGKTILSISELTMSQEGTHLFSFTSKDKMGHPDSLLISERSAS